MIKLGGEFGSDMCPSALLLSPFVVKELFHYKRGKATEILMKFLTLQTCSFWNYLILTLVILFNSKPVFGLYVQSNH